MYCIVLTTAPNREEAEQLATALLQDKLAACIQLIPIESFYTWEGKTAHEPEIQLMIKAKQADYSAIESKIQHLHSYDVPEIIQLPIQTGSQSYLNWINDVT